MYVCGHINGKYRITTIRNLIIIYLVLRAKENTALRFYEVEEMRKHLQSCRYPREISQMNMVIGL